VNSPLLEEQTDLDQAERFRLMKGTERAFSAAKMLIAVSRTVASYLEGRPEARGRTQIVPNGVNPSRFPRGICPSIPAPKGVFTLGLLGSLQPRNGLSTLVKAFGILHHRDTRCRLLIVGDGPAEKSLIDHLAASGLTKAAHLTGSVSPEEVPGLLASMDVAVAPYASQMKFYHSPLRLFEYMAAGLPVVASRVGQLAEMISDDVDGLLYPPGDALSLAAAIERLRQDAALRYRLGQAARVKALRDHSWNGIVRRILKLAGMEPGCEPALSGGEFIPSVDLQEPAPKESS
jgi:glycosyltransferase involved in cell wall biosynthesis